MINVALAYDNIGNSNILRGFFQSCAEDLRMFLGAHQNQLIEIPGANLNHISVQQSLSAIANRFVFVSFSHGRHDSLICDSDPPEYVSLNVNFDLFADTFFYTWSCLSSITLGPSLINNHGCSVYWGYRNIVWAPTDTAQQGIFIQCANRGIEQFINGNTVQASKDNAVAFYNDMIDTMVDSDYFLSARLRLNRDAMEVHGNMNLTIADFRV